MIHDSIVILEIHISILCLPQSYEFLCNQIRTSSLSCWCITKSNCKEQSNSDSAKAMQKMKIWNTNRGNQTSRPTTNIYIFYIIRSCINSKPKSYPRNDWNRPRKIPLPWDLLFLPGRCSEGISVLAVGCLLTQNLMSPTIHQLA